MSNRLRLLLAVPTAVASLIVVIVVLVTQSNEDAAEPLAVNGPDASLFLEAALADPPATVPCTLNDGTETECLRVTVVGWPVDHAVGPFCPPTTESTAAEGGIWFDGEGLYDIDGAFIAGLAERYGDDHWQLHDADGHVHITDTQAAFQGAARPQVAVEFQNHCVEGRLEWLPDGEPVAATVPLPTAPVLAPAPTANPARLGVTLNGVQVAGSAPVELILGAYTIAAFDDCGGHVNPADGYHYHAAPNCSEALAANHAPVFAYALDGFPIHLQQGEEDAATDQCGGHEHDGLGYHYHAGPPEGNAVIGCLSGAFVQTEEERPARPAR